MRWHPVALLAGLALLAACGGDETTPPDEPTTGGGGQGAGGSDQGGGVTCAPGEADLGHGLCLTCPPGTLELGDGSCQAAGVEDCGDGFVADDEGGCEAILPTTPCAPGELAIPGETACHVIADCGSGTWGDIATDATTQFVDASFAGGPSDGSESAPWTTIDEAIDAAEPGAVVAIAAGSYAEDLSLISPVILWGRCPSMVEIVGTGDGIATLNVYGGAASSVLRGVSLTGPSVGLAVWGVEGLSLEQLWVVDNAGRGINVENGTAPSEVVLLDSLVEGNTEHGIVATGSSLSVQRSVIRDNVPLGSISGRGITTQSHPDSELESSLELLASVVEGNREGGLSVSGGLFAIDRSVVRLNDTAAGGEYGRGMNIQTDAVTGQLADAVITRTVIEDNHETGVFVAGSTATLENVTVRRTLADDNGRFGRGASGQAHPFTNDAASLTVDRSSIATNDEAGLFAWGSHLDVRSTVVRSSGKRGVEAQANSVTASPSTATIEGCRIDDSSSTAVLLVGGDLTMTQTAITNTEAPPSTEPWAISAQSNDGGTLSSFVVTQCAVEGNRGTAIASFGADGQIERSSIRATAADPLGLFGDAITVIANPVQPTVALTAIRTFSSKRAAVFNVGSRISIEASYFECQDFDFNGEAGAFDYEFEDLGGNQCGCEGVSDDCKVVSTGLMPPDPLPPLEKD